MSSPTPRGFHFVKNNAVTTHTKAINAPFPKSILPVSTPPTKDIAVAINPIIGSSAFRLVIFFNILFKFLTPLYNFISDYISRYRLALFDGFFRLVKSVFFCKHYTFNTVHPVLPDVMNIRCFFDSFLSYIGPLDYVLSAIFTSFCYWSHQLTSPHAFFLLAVQTNVNRRIVFFQICKIISVTVLLLITNCSHPLTHFSCKRCFRYYIK